jgi:hypothetical protein
MACNDLLELPGLIEKAASEAVDEPNEIGFGEPDQP